MSLFSKNIQPYVFKELECSSTAERRGDPKLAFHHLERAHVLGQASTREHVRAHWAMLMWAIRHRMIGEAAGQIFRIVGAATKTAFGLIPAGNTGGTNVSPFRRLPIAADLESILDEAHCE